MIKSRNRLFKQLLKNLNYINLENIKSKTIELNKRFISITRRQLRPQSIETNESKRELLDVEKYRLENGIQCFGESIADPFQSFDSYLWPKQIRDRMSDFGFTTPTPIQSQSLPIILQRRDLVAIASSGSGKTLCFVLPALVRTLTSGLDYWPKCVILTPTRELTHQIEKVVKRFRFARSVCLYGGVSREIQSMILRDANPHIVIATPGRLEEVLKEKSAELKFVDYLVIDEADRMLSMGYETAFRYIMNSLPNKRQTLMFSATWPQNVQSIANEFLRDYIHVTVSQNSLNHSLTVNKNIEQIVHICNEEEKQIKLIECLNKYVPTVSGYTKTIIFVRKKRTADELTKLLKKEYLFSRALHSNKSQPERDFVIREFKRGTIPILIATDVASRGLDFQNVKLVVNYDFPSNIEDYIHRIGRTGRHTSKGTAFTLFTPQNGRHKSSLISVLQESGQDINQQLLDLIESTEPTTEELEDSGYDSSEESNDDSSDSNTDKNSSH